MEGSVLLFWSILGLEVLSALALAYVLRKHRSPTCSLTSAFRDAFQSIFRSVDKYVLEEVAGLRCRYFQGVLTGSWAFGITFLMAVQINIIRNVDRWFGDAETWTILAMSAFNLVAVCCPRAVTTTTSDAWYAVLMAFAGSMLFYMPQDRLEVYTGTTFLLRLAPALVARRLWLALLWNAAFTFIIVQRYANEPQSPVPCVSLQLVGQTVQLAFVYFSSIALLMRWLIDKQLCHQVEVRVTRTELSAATSLLGTMSDAVVELDEQLRFTEDAPHLSSLLLHSFGQCLAGTKFADFVYSEEDQRLLVEQLSKQQQTREDTEIGRDPNNQENGVSNCCGLNEKNRAQKRRPHSSIASAFLLRMRDSYGNILSVEVFHVNFQVSRQQTRHLIGVREYTDTYCLSERHLKTSPDSREGSHLVGAGTDSQWHGSDLDGASESYSSAIHLQPEELFLLSFNPCDNKIVQCDSDFKLYYGSSAKGHSLEKLFADSDQKQTLLHAIERDSAIFRRTGKCDRSEVQGLELQLQGGHTSPANVSLWFTTVRHENSANSEDGIQGTLALSVSWDCPHNDRRKKKHRRSRRHGRAAIEHRSVSESISISGESSSSVEATLQRFLRVAAAANREEPAKCIGRMVQQL